MDRLLRLYGKELEVSEEAAVAVNDTNKRRNHMNYRWLWKNGCYNGTFQRGSGVAAAGRVTLQISWLALAGGKNAACVGALLARLRSASRRAA